MAVYRMITLLLNVAFLRSS